MTAPTSGRPLGRRPADSGTRETILAAARSTFAESGYDGASLRAIARRAGVDAALPHHCFGSKEGLFAASHLVGLALARYVLRIDALADLPLDTVVAAVGPAVQAYLTDELA